MVVATPLPMKFKWTIRPVARTPQRCKSLISSVEQSNKNITNADVLISIREKNLTKENEETQANINNENMQDLDDQQPSEKDVQPEDISNARLKSVKKNSSLRNTLTWALRSRALNQ
ncbi:hypothetical protein TNCV_3481631 [Trichonephila clavipes]|nr:hypothetical protein TNCV_3481631 [Trichonephila clavipes]